MDNKKIIKFGYYYPVREEQKQEIILKIQKAFIELIIRGMDDLLLNPTKVDNPDKADPLLIDVFLL